MGQYGVDGKLCRVDRDGERREGTNIGFDEYNQRVRGFLPQIGEVGAKILAVQGVQIGKVVEVDRVEKVEQRNGDEFERGDARKVPVKQDVFGRVSPVVGADGQFPERWEALVRQKAKLCSLTSVLKMERLQIGSGQEQVFEGIQSSDEWWCRMGHLERNEELDRNRPQVRVAHFAFEIPERQVLDVKLGLVAANLCGIEHVGWRPKPARLDRPV